MRLMLNCLALRDRPDFIVEIHQLPASAFVSLMHIEEPMTTSRVATSTDDWREQLNAQAAAGGAAVFQLGTRLLKQGRTNLPLAATKTMSVVLKCYAEGGENELHAHPFEDHVFILLQGEACFFAPDGKTTQLSANQGIMLPAGTVYSFKASGDENLVLLRIGATVVADADPLARIDVQGRPFDGYSTENKRTEVVFDGSRTFRIAASSTGE
jgi:quercetin dioxygenase-like cupin family protein